MGLIRYLHFLRLIMASSTLWLFGIYASGSRIYRSGMGGWKMGWDHSWGRLLGRDVDQLAARRRFAPQVTCVLTSGKAEA
jgi:hypothetical protein